MNENPGSDPVHEEAFTGPEITVLVCDYYIREVQAAIAELVNAARTADAALRGDIRRALAQIKTQNEGPVVRQAVVSCAEGGSAVLEVPCSAWDSMPGDLSVSVADGPGHGTLERQGENRFVYHSSRGFTGTDSVVCRVSDGEGASTRARATVHVRPDKTAPQVEEVASGGRPGKLRLMFSEPVARPAAEKTSNYSIGPDINVVRAQLGDYGMTVTLTVTPLSEEQDYVLEVRNVADRSASRNRIATVRKRLTYYDGEHTGPVVVAEDIEEERTRPAQGDERGGADRVSSLDGSASGIVGSATKTAETGDATAIPVGVRPAFWLQGAEKAGQSTDAEQATR